MIRYRYLFFVLLISLLASVSPFWFPTAGYSKCQERTATYLDGTEVDVTGYCNVTDFVIEFGEMLDLSECQDFPASTFQLRGCTGNYINHYPVPF